MELEPRCHGDGFARITASAGSAHLVDREPKRGAAFRAGTVRALDVPPDEVLAPVLPHRPLVPGSNEQPAFSLALNVDDDGAMISI
ncbi:hypothetical protein [Microbacterium sp. 10M-3C3]|uniref:hypothetical protein n=1 Tax=Microbacterium sp. 10M-3C3 TaxID=2483401 RepID=UPI000F63DDEC|nr:hypothetical protein [Microbacterium sp. 10M-3C3]